MCLNLPGIFWCSCMVLFLLSQSLPQIIITSGSPTLSVDHQVKRNGMHLSTERATLHGLRLQEGKRGGGGSSSLKLNLTDPCRTWGMPGRWAVSTVSVCASTVQCRELKTGQQRVHFYCEDEIHCRSGYSLSMDCGKWALYSTLHTVLLICTLLRF